MNSLLHLIKQILFIVFSFVTAFILLTPLWLLLHLYKQFVILVTKICQLNLARVLTPFENAMVEEDCTKYRPKCTLVCSLTLDGDIQLEELRELFERNVLEATLQSSSSLKFNPAQIRYPELTQYQVDFMGYRFWKEDPNFRIENHVFEMVLQDSNLVAIHQEAINKLYYRNRSPWEIILIRFNDGNEILPKTLIIARFHHSMADARSMIKLLVECLGGQPLTVANPQQKEENFVKELLYYTTFPIQFLSSIGKLILNSAANLDHKWRADVFSNEKETQKFSHVIGLSPKLLLDDIKKIAKKHNGTTSSVIMAIVSGAVGKFMDEKFMKKSIAGYILPKPDHPPTLTTHACVGAVLLPTDEKSASKRLLKCNTEFNSLKKSKLDRYNDFVGWQSGAIPNLLRNTMVRNAYFPIGITNIAGEANGLSIAGRNCSEFIFSAGTLRGCQGVLLCVSSYMEFLRISVIAKNTIFDDIQVQKLANAIGDELTILKQIVSAV